MGKIAPNHKKRHRWQKVDKDDRFRKVGRYEVKRVREVCIDCGKERIREVKRRFK